MTDFKALGLAEPLLRAVTKEGYDTPTPIQAEVIPAVLAGNDILGTAQTGTGKTAAFVLPILHKILEAKKIPSGKCCHALILAPTRELAAQIADSVRTYGKFTKMSVATVVGGARPGPQVNAMKRGVDVLVATPGRLLDHVNTGAIRLEKTHTVVLDEADQMMDLGFMPAVRKVLEKIHGARQTLLLSATMPKPIRGLANEILRHPAEISVAPVAKPIELIEQHLSLVSHDEKRDRLIEILSGEGVDRAIVFTRTKRGADRVTRWLEDSGLRANAIHGDKSQGQRERALADFKKGRVNILVATDIAARGIDIDDVSHVVNYELPNMPESYVHRIGRTARAGRSGVAISLCCPDETSYARDIEVLTGVKLLPEGTKILPPPKQNQRGGGQKPQGQRSAGPRKQEGRPQGARPQGARSEVRRSEGFRSEGTRQEGQRSEGYRPEGKRQEGFRSEGKRPEGKRPEGKRPEGQRSEGAPSQGRSPRQQQARPNTARPEGANSNQQRAQQERPQQARAHQERDQKGQPKRAHQRPKTQQRRRSNNEGGQQRRAS